MAGGILPPAIARFRGRPAAGWHRQAPAADQGRDQGP